MLIMIIVLVWVMILIKMIVVIMVIATKKIRIVSETVSVMITAQWICHIMQI